MTESSHSMIDLLDKTVVYKANASAHRFKISQTIRHEDDLEPDDIGDLEKVIEFHELAIVDYWKFAFDSNPDNRGQKEVFHRTCKRCLNLMEVCPVPENPVQRIIHVLKMTAYAYLGEKWEDMRRYLKKNEAALEIEPAAGSDWDYRLLVNIYKAILHLTRRSSWEDLSKAGKIIANLREQQREFEEKYLGRIDAGRRNGAAHQLASLYHLAKSVELAGEFMLRGTPNDIEVRLDSHFDNAVSHSQAARIVDLEIVLMVLRAVLKKMTRNSVWTAAFRINPTITKFVESITKPGNPVFEFLYPQRVAILESGLLDPASDAVVVNMPTSSGKTMIAEFKILEAVNAFGDDGKIVYVVPTRALVNQITARLRRDLGADPLGIKIEKVSGAVEIDGFEDSLISAGRSFNVLVTTPEKLQLLIRNPESHLAESIVLTIIDEAHNLGNDTRGLRLEMLLSIIKRDCRRSKFLLLTPFVPNSEDIAEWLGSRKPRSIGMELDWKPNDLVVGICYAEGKRREISTFFKPLITSRSTITLDEHIPIGRTESFSEPASQVRNTKYKLASLIATQLDPSQSFLVLASTVKNAWKTAELIYENLTSDSDIPEDVLLVKKFIKSEISEDFPLARYLDRRIGVHHAGLPDEIRNLMEWLLESGHLRALVATTTIAQGVNFPISGILVSSYAYPGRRDSRKKGSSRITGKNDMPSRDFWNLIGRAGRIDQPALGLVGIVVDEEKGDQATAAAKYVKKSAENLTSVLAQMVTKALGSYPNLDLSRLARELPEWSGFVQYIAHMKNQSESLGRFIAESELVLRQTYGYGRLDSEKQEKLLNAVKSYAEWLDSKPHASYLSDLTGFAPETIESATERIADLGMEQADWSAEGLFSPASNKLAPLVGIMLNSIPEVKDLSKIASGGPTLQQRKISLIISDWVSGKGIAEIAKQHFENEEDSITECVRAIYGKIVNSATWGIAGIQKIPDSGLEFDRMPDLQRKQIANLPAMVYYGVDSEEAILMRMHSVPRSVSKRIGSAYIDESGGYDIYSRNTADVLAWLGDLPEGMWQPESPAISGSECKKIWRRLSGT